MGDDVLHISLKKWANIILISPLSANTLAKISQGISDNTITLILRAIKFENGKINKDQKVFVAPAMNTDMWNHPITAK